MNVNTVGYFGKNTSRVTLGETITQISAMAAIKSGGTVVEAGDDAGIRVIGIFNQSADLTSGDDITTICGTRLFLNSSTSPLAQTHIGEVAYVEDEETVASTSTYLNAAGTVVDVTSAGVYVNMQDLALARKLARCYVVAVTGATKTVSSDEAYQGNVVITCSNNSGVAVTMPTAVAGARIGFIRQAAGAGYDVTITAATGDTIRGSAVAGTITNSTDAISNVLWLEAENATNWADGSPLAGDRAVWIAS